MEAQLPWLVLLLLLASLFLAGSAASGASGLHPVVLLPGYSCSKLDARLTDEYQPPPGMPGCGARKGKGWFRLWENYTALQEDPSLLPCYADQLRLVYDRVADDYRNTPGVRTRVVGFGTTRAFGSGDPIQLYGWCMEKLVKALEVVGYKEGGDLFGAPYDFRYAAAPPGKPSREFSYFLSSLRRLVEHASERNEGRPVILVAHSMGGFCAIEFLKRMPLPWRRRYAKHFVMLSYGVGGSPFALQVLAAGIENTTLSPGGQLLSFANTSRSFASTFTIVPSPVVFGHAPLVITRGKNYSAYDMPEFLTMVGFSGDEVVARYTTRALPVTLNFSAPLVPMTSINGVGVPTPRALVFWNGDFRAEPQVVYGDGDNAVSLESVLALDTIIGADPDQCYFKSILLPNTTHGGVILDDLPLKMVVGEILEANQVMPQCALSVK